MWFVSISLEKNVRILASESLVQKNVIKVPKEVYAMRQLALPPNLKSEHTLSSPVNFKPTFRGLFAVLFCCPKRHKKMTGGSTR